jgi:hypothetical protein
MAQGFEIALSKLMYMRKCQKKWIETKVPLFLRSTVGMITGLRAPRLLVFKRREIGWQAKAPAPL